jgi:hypothetical protein
MKLAGFSTSRPATGPPPLVRTARDPQTGGVSGLFLHNSMHTASPGAEKAWPAIHVCLLFSLNNRYHCSKS